MRLSLKILPLLLVSVLATGQTTHYVAASGGTFSTLAEVNAHAFVPGDVIRFHRGETWTGTLTLASSASGTIGSRITIGTYGSGAKPIITVAGNISLGSWSAQGGNVYRMSLTTFPGRLWFGANRTEYGIAYNSANITSRYRWATDASGTYGDQCTYIDVYSPSGNPTSYYGSLYSAMANGTHALQVSGKNYITIDSIDFQGGNNCWEVSGCSNWILDGVEVGKYGSNGGGIQVNAGSSSDNWEIRYSRIDPADTVCHNFIYGGYRNYGWQGEGIGIAQGAYWNVHHNYIGSWKHTALSVGYVSSVGHHIQVHDNEFDGSTVEYSKAIGTYGYSGYYSHDVEIYRNWIHDFPTVLPLAGTNHWVYYNLFERMRAVPMDTTYNNPDGSHYEDGLGPRIYRSAALWVFGVENGGSENIKILNNTFRDCAAAAIILHAHASNTTVYNNLMYLTGTTTHLGGNPATGTVGVSLAVSWNSGASDTADHPNYFRNNLAYTSTGNPYTYHQAIGGWYNDGWSNVVPTGAAAFNAWNGFVGDVVSGNLAYDPLMGQGIDRFKTLAGSVARGNGYAIPVPPSWDGKDYYGTDVVNSTGAIDVGAYQSTTAVSSGTTYYVSSSGSDANNGTSSLTPWKTIQWAMNHHNPGDIVQFNRGEIFVGTIYPKAGSTYKDYGSGTKPRIGPVETLSGWNIPGNWTETIGGSRRWVWHSSIIWDNVILDGILYAHASSQGNVDVSTRWFHTKQPGGDGDGSRGVGTLTVYSNGNPASYYSSIQVSAGTYDYAVDGTNGADNCSFQNLVLWGGSRWDNTVTMNGCTGWTFNSCDIGWYADAAAMNVDGQSDNLRLYYCTIDRKTPFFSWTVGGDWNGGGDGIMMWGGDYFLADHCVFVNLRHGSINTYPVQSAYPHNATTNTMNYGEVRYCEFDGGTSDYSYAFINHAVRLYPIQNYGWKFHHNYVHDMTIMPMEVRGHGFEIYENFFYRNSHTSGVANPGTLGVIGIFANTEGPNGTCYSRNVKVYNNTLLENETVAISLHNSAGNANIVGPDSIFIFNNILCNNSQNASIDGHSDGMEFWSAGLSQTAVVHWRNNIVYNSASVGARATHDQYPPPYATPTWRNMSWFVQGNAYTNEVFSNFTGADPYLGPDGKIGASSYAIDHGFDWGYRGTDFFGSAVPYNGVPDIGIHEYAATNPPPGDPVITVSTNNLVTFGLVEVGSVTASQSYTISAVNLLQGVLITVPYEFEVSPDNVSWYAQMTVGSTGILTDTPVYIRFHPTSQGTKAGSVTNSSYGAMTRTVQVTGTGVGLPIQSNIKLAKVGQNYSPTYITRIAVPITVEGTDRYLLTSLAYWTAGAGICDSVKLKNSGVKLVKKVRKGGGNGAYVETWGKDSPPVGSDSILIFGLFSDIEAAAQNYTGVDQNLSLGMIKADSGNSGTPSVTVSASVGDLIVDALYSFNVLYECNQTQIIMPHGPDFDTDLSCSMKYATQGQNTMSWSISPARIWAQTAIVLKAKAPPGPSIGARRILVASNTGKYLLIRNPWLYLEDVDSLRVRDLNLNNLKVHK